MPLATATYDQQYAIGVPIPL